MKRLFFFRSSGNGKETDSKMKTTQPEQEFNSPKSQRSNGSQAALRRSVSLSSADFLFDNLEEASTKELSNDTKSRDRQRNHSSRCFTPERQARERHCESNKFQHDSSGSSSSCSSNVSSRVVDRYIDGEEHIERRKQKSSSSSHGGDVSGSLNRKKLPPRAQWTVPTSPLDTLNDKEKSHSFREAKGTRLRISSSNDYVEKELRHGSTRSLARNVIEKLSQTSSNHNKPITIQDVYGGSNGSLADYEPVDDYYIKSVDSELEMKIKEAEKRVEFFTEELEQQRLLSDCDFDVSSLVEVIRKLESERVNLAFENVTLLRSQMDEKRRVKSDWGLHIQRIEKEKNELQSGLEKELDRRSCEWTTKLERFQFEEKKLRERVRELAEQNVSLQRELSSLHENEIESKDMLTHLERRVTELTVTVDELDVENSDLKQSLTELKESYGAATEDIGYLRRNFEEKDHECKELRKSVTKFLRTCKEQEKTIEGLRDEKPSETELVRLTGIELSLRKELQSMKVETDSLRQENICLLNRLKENGAEVDVKLESELRMGVSCLQEQGLSMLNESNQICYKLLKFIKGKLTSMEDGLSEQFMIESEMKVHGVRRGVENLKRSLQTVTNVVASNSESIRPKEQRNRSVEETLRAELRGETLITSLLREKLYSREEEIEQLQAEVAAAVRGNEILRCEVQSGLDNLSVKTHELKDVKLQMLKKEENINRLETNLKEAVKDISSMKTVLPKVTGERDQIWRELRQCCEKNMLLGSENEMLRGNVEKLEERLLEKDGEITILQDTIESKHMNLLSSPDFLV